ncbi:MAG: MFS transporter [Clostridia bacterium]|nr:MFS transporter [Clostridia bacterium]
MEKCTSRKAIRAYTWLFCLSYTISYMTRINYGAIVSAMEETLGEGKDVLSLALTCSFVTYGVGQIVSGMLGDRFSPKRLVALGFLVTTLMNLLVPFFPNPTVMLILWGINGFAQALMWPPMVRILVAMFDDETYKNITAKISCGASYGTIAVYLLSPLLLLVSDYRSVFWFSSAMGALMLALWLRFAPDVGKREENPISLTASSKEATRGTWRTVFTPMFLMIMVGIALQGMLRDGVTTWMPSYISEIYDISNILSILSGVIMPVFSVFCVRLSTLLYQKKVKNPTTLAGFFFLASAVAALVLFLSGGKNLVISILSFALLIGGMHGTNLMLTTMLPPYFKGQGKVSTVSGVLNSCTYVGSAVSTYGIALLSTRMGWNFTVALWVLTAVLGALVCLFAARLFARRFSLPARDAESTPGANAEDS